MCNINSLVRTVQGVRHGFKIGGAKASKLLKIYCKFKEFIDFL